MASTKNNNAQKKQAIGYTRVSTGQQVKEGISLDAQKEKIHAWCDYHGYDLMGVFTDEGISGASMKNRKELERALKVIKKDMAFVTYSLSRLTRSTRDLFDIAEFINKKDADLVSLSEKIDTTSAAGKMVFRMLGVINEFERDQTSERTRLVKQHKKAKGEYNGGFIPYGYKLSDDKKLLIPVSKEQKVIEAAKQLREEGKVLWEIVFSLEKQGYFTRNGKVFTPWQISRMLGEARK
jgi:site-specific DNA recombinase